MIKKYRITTTLRPGIKDMQGDAVANALRSMGYDMVENVRIGKTIHIECDENLVDGIAKSVYNEVMENYVIEEL